MILENNMIMSNHFDNIHIIHSLYLVVLLYLSWGLLFFFVDCYHHYYCHVVDSWPFLYTVSSCLVIRPLSTTEMMLTTKMMAATSRRKNQ